MRLIHILKKIIPRGGFAPVIPHAPYMFLLYSKRLTHINLRFAPPNLWKSTFEKGGAKMGVYGGFAPVLVQIRCWGAYGGLPP